MKRINLASNENPFGPSPKAVEGMRAAAEEANFYPDDNATDLRLKLAERFALKPEQVLVASGSSELIYSLAHVLLAPGLNAVASRVSFILYPMAVAASAGTLVQTPMQDNGFDLDAIAGAINDNTRLVYLANPNNPTGTIFDAAALDRFLERVPKNVLVALDEAYSDFAGHFAAERRVVYSRALDHVRAGRPNLVVLRTFSKAHGLAGLRIGYGMGSAELIAKLAGARPAFAVSSVAQAAALAALEDEAHVRRGVENNAAGAEFLTCALAELGFCVAPTWANFIYVELDTEAAPIAKRLEQEGVLVRPLALWGAPTAMRVTIGTPEQNEFFLNAMRNVMVSRERYSCPP